jgi:DNA-directed RNA polymerase specialized sigma24 family protein
MYQKNPEEIKNPLGYLLRTIHNVWTDKWSKEKAANTESLDVFLENARPPAVEPEILSILEIEELQKQLTVSQGPLTSREKNLLKFYMEGYKCKDIATMLDEDVRLTRVDLNALKAKIRYRLMKANLRR